jgi:hypothetical protein
MTKGVSIVAGLDDPLSADVVRSRKNKDLLTFVKCVSGAWGSASAVAAGILAPNPHRQATPARHSGRLNGTEPLQNAGFLGNKGF